MSKTTPRPNYDFALRKEWTAALRSGKYKQGNGKLHQGDCFCVLGVLADLFVKKYPHRVKISKVGDVVAYDGCAFVLPGTIVGAVGLTDADGAFKDGLNLYNDLLGETERSLTTLNDRSVSFKDMANIIDNPKCNVFLK